MLLGHETEGGPRGVMEKESLAEKQEGFSNHLTDSQRNSLPVEVARPAEQAAVKDAEGGSFSVE